MKTTTTKGWVARNGTGKLIFHEYKPGRCKESLMTDEELRKEEKRRVHYPREWVSNGVQIPFKKLPVDESIFSDLKWEDDPIEVELSLTIR